MLLLRSVAMIKLEMGKKRYGIPGLRTAFCYNFLLNGETSVDMWTEGKE